MNSPIEPDLPDWLRTARPDGPEAQWETWPYRTWKRDADLAAFVGAREAIEQVEDWWAIDDGCLRRRRLHDVAEGPILPWFVAVMAWGYGPSGLGAHRVAKILRDTPDSVDRLTAIRASSLESASAGWAALFDRETAVKGLAASFGTKLVHFAGYNRVGAHPRPLILDENVAQGLRDAGVPLGSVWRHDDYLTYCDIAERWASELAQSTGAPFGSDAIEFALFGRGRDHGRLQRRDARIKEIGERSLRET